MSKTSIVNAGSQILNQGIKDNSRGATVELSDNVPQHCPLVFLWAQRGPTERTLGGSADHITLYGADTFKNTSKFYNHQTAYAELFNISANRKLIQRLIPKDIGPKANIRIYADILETDINNYVRNSDGSIATDSVTDEMIIDSDVETIPGIKLRFIAETITDEDMVTSTGTMKEGTMTDGENTSTMYPFLDVPAKFLGSDYNNSGFIIESIIAKDKDTNLVTGLKSLLYKLFYVRRVNEKSSAVLQENIYGGVYSQFTLNGAIDATTQKEYTLQNASDTFENETNIKYPIKYNEFEEFYLYQDNIDTILTKIMENEKDYISLTPKVWNNNVSAATFNWFDFLSAADKETLVTEEKYLCNLLTGYSSKNVRYFTLEIDKSSTGIGEDQIPISFASNTPIWLAGGSDGTLSEENFEEQVKIELEKYLDYNSDVMDTAINVETVLYDSGFTIPVKEMLPYFISTRKNTFVSIATHVDNLNRPLTNEEEYQTSALIAIKASIFPESEFYATKACRSMLTIGSGISDIVSYKRRLPQNFDIAYKTAAYMGAANGKWVEGYDFSMGGDNQVEVLKNLTPTQIPNNLKEMLWDVNANWSQASTRKTYFFPALQTIYPYDDSVLNSYFVIWIVLRLQTISDKCWRKFSGNYKDSKAELAKKITDYFNEQIEDAFDGFKNIVPEVQFTAEDVQRGYSWTLIISIYANVARTVQTSAVFAYRQAA